jgi:hypothetical protein
MIGRILQELAEQGGRAAVKNVDDFYNKLLVPALSSAAMTGDRVLQENLINEAKKLGFKVPSLPGPGLIGESPSATQAAIKAVRSQQAPVPEFGRGVAARRPVVPQTSPVTQLGPKPPEPAGALVPLGDRGVTSAVRREIPSAEFMPELAPQAPLPGNLTGPQGKQLTVGTTRFPAGSTAPTEMVSRSGRVTPEGASVGGRVMPEAGVPAPNPRDPEVQRVLDSLKAADEFPIPGTRFGPRPADPFLDDQLSLFVKRDPSITEQLAKFDAVRMPAGASSPLGRQAPRPEFNVGGINEQQLIADAFTRKSAGQGMNFGRDAALAALLGTAGYGAIDQLGALNQAPQSQEMVDTVAANAATGGEPAANVPALGTTNPVPPSISPSPTDLRGDTSTSTQRSLLREAVATDPTAAAAVRMTEPLSPEKYGSLAEYRKAVSDYAGQADKTRELVEFMRTRGSSPEMSTNLATWAEANPALAYALQQREYAKQNNQQSAEVSASSSVGSSLGTSNTANAVGNAAFAGDAAVEGTQGSYDLKSATDMVLLPRTMRTSAPALLDTYLTAVGAQ